MLLSVLIALQQMPAGSPAGQPVRLTLEPSTIAPGDAVHAFVEVATAGHLIVLRIAADGRAEVVFPAQPSEGTFVSAGSYEIQPPGQTSAFIANERAGGGLVLAALALVPYEFGEFVRGDAWDARALASGAGSDATGRLLDVVQRMLGPEYFHYDAAPYTVAPYTTASEDIGAAYGYAAYGGFAPCYGYGCFGFTPEFPLHPCFDGGFGCGGHRPAICDPFTGLWDCGPAAAFCRAADPVWCRRPTAVARYRRGELIGEAASAQPTYGLSAVLNETARRKPPTRTAAPAVPASRPTTLSSGRKPATTSASRPAVPGVSSRTKAGAPGARPAEARLPERVPWPGQVLARGTKTAAPAVSPREARLKQSASRPPLPERVPWPTGVAPRSAKPAAAAPPTGLATATPRGVVPALGVPRTKEAASGAPAGAAGSTRSLAPAAPARGPASAGTAPRALGGARAAASAGKGSSAGARASAPAGGASAVGSARASGGSGKH